MRLELTLQAVADAAYDTTYYHKLRGRIWRGLEEHEQYVQNHGAQSGVGFAFSNVFPWGEINEGDCRYLRIASPRHTLLDDLFRHFRRDQRFDIGQMRFEVNEITRHAPDVGEPGSTGRMDTGTGILCALDRQLAEEHGLDTTEIQSGESETKLFWRREHGMEPLLETIRRSLQRTHEAFGDEYYAGPMEVDQPLFERIDPIKNQVTYPIKYQPATAVERTAILSKWRFGYRVRDDTHRYHLNLALDAGLGQKREHGFGFVNLREQTPPRAE